MPSGRRDRLADRRRTDSPLHLRRHPPPVEAGRKGTGRARRRAGRACRDARVERLPAHGALLRRLRHGADPAHDQPAALPGAARVHRQSCRRPVPVLRPDVRAARRKARAAPEDRQGLRRDDRPRAHADGKHSAPPVLRGARRRAERRLRVARRSTKRPRRRCAIRPGPPANPKGVLYSHRSTVLHSYAVCAVDGLAPFVRGIGAAGRADVPRQRVGHAVRRRDVRREARDARPRARRQERLRADARREGDGRARRAYRLADAVQARRRGGRRPEEGSVPEARGHRRLRRAARDERAVRDAVRRVRRSCLGDDRDVAARHGLQSAAQASRLYTGAAARRCRGSRGARSTASRCKITDDAGNAAAARRQGLRPSDGARAVDHPRLLQGRGRGRFSTPTASSTPATSRPSTPTATCRSPTARRT